MLLNLPVSLFPHRVYNEIHLGLCNLFACLGMKPEVYEMMAMLEDLGKDDLVGAVGRYNDEYLWINFDIPSSLEDQVRLSVRRGH